MSNELSIDNVGRSLGEAFVEEDGDLAEFAADDVEVALGRVRLGIDRVARAGEAGLELGERFGRRGPAIE